MPLVRSSRRQFLRVGSAAASLGFAGAPLDARGDGLDRGVPVQPLDLVGVQVADERDPAIVGKRPQQDVPLRAGDQRHPVAGQPAADAHVRCQRRAGVGLAEQNLVQRFARDAVRASGADHPLHVRRLLNAIRVPELDSDAVRGRVHRACRNAPLDLAAELDQPLRQDLLGAVLRQAALELARAAGAGERDLADGLELIVEHTRIFQVHRPRQEWIEGSRAGENLERSRLDDGGARLAMGVGFALDEPCLYAVARELSSCEQAGRAGADDQHLGGTRFIAHGISTIFPCVCRSASSRNASRTRSRG